jgi:oligopeptide transport system ATP-binding protein
MPVPPLLQVRDLTVQFHTDDGIVRAVDGVSFDLERGETLGLVGESGCGKSVSALSILRLIPQPPGRIVRGEVLFDGVDLLKLSESQLRRIRGAQIAMIFQDPLSSLNPVLSIGHQVGEALERHKGLRGRALRNRVLELLDLVRLPDPQRILDAYPHQLSGGMRQRAMIAAALSCDPQILIADEPTTALDVTVQDQILELIRDLADQFHAAIILITHNLGVVAGMADRVNVMYAGQIVETGPVDEIFADPAHPYTQGLLASIPRLDRPLGERLRPIEGTPAVPIGELLGCPFAPRCEYATEQSRTELPTLEPYQGNERHQVACWVAVQQGKTRVMSNE